MPHGDRLHHASLIILALAVAVYVIWLVGVNRGVEEGQATGAEYRAQVHHENAAEEIERNCLLLDGPEQTVCIQEAIETSGEYQRAEQDLAAQENMAKFAKRLLDVTAITAGVTTFGLVFIWRTLQYTRTAAEHTGTMLEEARKATLAAEAAVVVTRDLGEAQVREAEKATRAAQESAVVTREMGQAQLRAYVSTAPDPREGNTSGFFNAGQPGITFVLQNTGNSPAFRLRYVADLIVGPSGGPPLTKDLLTVEPDAPFPPMTLAPGSPITPMAEARSWITPTVRGQVLNPESPLHLYMAGVIFYDDVFGTVYKQRFCYEMIATNTGQGSKVATDWILTVNHNDEQKLS